ncbi:NADPH-dependent FMN reductase, partial [Comamonas sp.]|uniref:NADPH-dependent FMN reductase n=1 Tax=Comamonas sp. TaxID=34028 RepID=UPI0026475C80
MKSAIALCCNACMQILIFAGSTRQDSYNRKLAKVAASIARQQGAEPSLLELSDYDIPLYNADLEAQGTPADVIRLKQAMHRHAAWIVCSP